MTGVGRRRAVAHQAGSAPGGARSGTVDHRPDIRLVGSSWTFDGSSGARPDG